MVSAELVMHDQPDINDPNEAGLNEPQQSARSKADQAAKAERDRENAEDLKLFREFTAGSRDAYTQLYLKYRQRVYAYCLRVLCDEDEAKDLFQEVFVRVYERSHQFQEERSLGGWIFTIAHNLCLNKIRDRKPNEGLDDLQMYTSPADDYGDSWKERIAWALEQIPVDYREAFVLREYEGLSYQEIAEILKTTLPAVKSRIYRSKERLRVLLEPYYRDGEAKTSPVIKDED
jgi:RNA polymerase sigma-70 factor, ECF subfamily